MILGKCVLRSLVLSSVVLSVLLPCVASAQIEEIVVTAQKREENIQNVGISVTAISGKDLENLGMKNTTQITQQVPGLQMSAWSPEFTTFSLRGVSQTNFQDNLEAPVAVYMDGVYVATMNALNGQLFDVERVEVLRGPQGTLFGRNATGGLIHFLTRKATSQDANGYLEVGGAEWNTYNVEGAFGGSFSDHVRGRIAGRYEKSDGYMKAGVADLGGGPVQATGRTVGGANGFALRGNLQFDATDNVLIDLTGQYSKDDDVPTGQYAVTFVGFNPVTGLGAFHNAVDPADGVVKDFSRTPITGNGWRHWSNENPYFNRDVKSATAQITAKLGGGTEFVSITNYMKMNKFYIEDSGGGLVFFPYNTVNDYKQWSQEFRLSGGEDKFRWQIGAYYLDMVWDTFQSVAGAAILSGITGSPSDTQKLSTYGKIDSTNWSGFGQVEFDLASNWTLIGGLRWSQDNKDLAMHRVYEDVPQGVQPVETFNINNVAIPDIAKIDYGDYAARLQLNWKAQEHTLLYLAYNRGIKGGNWSLDPLGAVADANLKHGPEKLNAYELGLKTDLFEGKARLNAALFYYDYKDYQAFSIVGLTPQVTNSDATAHGGEVELTVAPGSGFYFLLGAAFENSTVDAVPDVFGGTVKANFPLAPKLNVNLLGRYEWPAFGGKLGAQLDGKWNDDQYLEGTNSEVSFEPSYAVLNASVDFVTGNDKTRVSLWVKNFTNEEYRVYDLDLGLLGFIEQSFGPPRQVGLTASYHW
jgi:iron complex outermembrane receptor protein